MVSIDRLTPEKRAQILHLLCEGSSIRAITRIAAISKNTVTKLIEDVGRACAAFHDETVRDLKTKRVQADEIWSFTYAKLRRLRPPQTVLATHGLGPASMLVAN